MLSIATMASNVEHYKFISLPQNLKLSLSFLFSNDSSDDSSSQRPLQLQSQRQLSRQPSDTSFFTTTSIDYQTLLPISNTFSHSSQLNHPSHLSISTTTSNRNNGPNQKTEPKRSPEPTPKSGWPACRSSSTNPITTKRSRLPSWGDDLL